MKQPTKLRFYNNSDRRVLQLIPDQENQRSDKVKTYDLAHSRYPHTRSILLLDADELLLCSPALQSLSLQAKYQRQLLNTFGRSDYEEIRFRRNFYYPSVINESLNYQNIPCMVSGFSNRNISEMLACWSGMRLLDDESFMFTKSANKHGCPFNYVHFSCGKYWSLRW